MPDLTPAAEPVPVPPPVDALLKLAKDVDYLVGGLPALDWNADAAAARIKTAAQGLWAAGVEEGRQQLDEVQKLAALHGYELGVAEGRREDERALMQALMERDDYEEIADKLTSAVGRHLGVDMGEHSNANSPWENALNALDEADGGKFVKGAYEAGVTEGRRQATEERTEEQQGDDRG